MVPMIKRSLANKITLVISLVFIVVFTITGVFTASVIRQNVMEFKTHETYLQAESISKDVRSIFENARMVTNQLALHPEIVSYLKTATSKDSIRNNPYFLPTLQTLIKVKESGSFYYLAWVANEKANFYLDSMGVIPDDTYDVKKRPWYPVAVAAEDVSFTPPYVEWGTKRVVISSIKPLRENGQIYGFVVMDIVLENIPVIFHKGAINPGDKNFLIGSDGTYMYHENPEKIMKAHITDVTDSLYPYRDAIQSSKKELQEVIYSGKAYFMMSYPVSENGWKVVSLIDKANIDQSINRLKNQIFLSLLSAMVITVVLAYIVVRRFTQPYDEVLVFAEDIARGNFEQNIPNSFITRTDEMGQMSRAFQKIIEAFRGEKNQLERRIVEKNTELEAQYQIIMETEKAASLGNLVAGVAHEINTPLGVSLTTASYLKKINTEQRQKLAEGHMNRDDLRELMEVVDESVALLDTNLNRAAELVKSFKQVAADQSSGNIGEFKLRETVEGVIVSLRHEYKHLPVLIENRCPEEIVMHSYPGAISQIVTNLIMNSLQHGLTQTVQGRILITATAANGSVRLVYQDNGRGVSKENLRKIYDPFFTTRRQEGNTGLGMHIVMNLVTQKLKGTVRCDSDEGKGVKFTFEIPSHLGE